MRITPEAARQAVVHAMVQAVKAHAQEHYEQDGWDYVIETYTDEELAETIGNATTIAGAIRRVHTIVKTIDGVRRDIQGA